MDRKSILDVQRAHSASDAGAIRRQVRACLDLVRRRTAWIVLTTLGVAIVVAVVALRLPSIYRAEALIIVDLQRIPDGAVPASVTSNVSNRLSTLREEVRSPAQLGPLVEEFGLYPELRGKVSERELVSRLQRSTTIETADSGGTRANAFRIAFRDTNPNHVAPVANRLASLFIQRNLKEMAREVQVQATVASLEPELEETKRQLQEKERLVQEARSRYVADLSKSKQDHLEAVNRLRDQLRNSRNQVSQDRQSKVRLQTMASKSSSTSDPGQQGTPGASPLQAQIRELDMELKDLEGRYAPDHPSVENLRKEIEQLKAKAESGKAAPADPRVKMPTHQSEAEVTKLDQDIAEQTKKQVELEKQVQFHLGRLQQVPAVEQQIAGLTQDYESLREHYHQLQAKRLDAEVAGELESPQARERFKILQAAVPPQAPEGPRRAVAIVGGVLFGLMCGIAVAFLAELGDRSVRHEREAALIFGKPLLGAIPKIANDRERARAFWRMASLTAGTAVAALALGLAISRMVL